MKCRNRAEALGDRFGFAQMRFAFTICFDIDMRAARAV